MSQNVINATNGREFERSFSERPGFPTRFCGNDDVFGHTRAPRLHSNLFLRVRVGAQFNQVLLVQ